MAAGYSTPLRNARLDAITTFTGNAAKLRIYSGTRPATGGSTTTLLAELTLGSPLAGAASGGLLTFNTITGDTSADASGTANWFRIVKSDGTTFVMDGAIGATGSGAELEMSNNVLTAGLPVDITAFTITTGNA